MIGVNVDSGSPREMYDVSVLYRSDTYVSEKYVSAV